MVKSGLGIGLMGNYTLSDPNIVPLDLGVHIKLPLYLLAESDRLNSKPVRVVYDWLAELFGTRNPVVCRRSHSWRISQHFRRDGANRFGNAIFCRA